MAAKPRMKLDKKEAKKGEIVEVKALVAHVMESGQRKNAKGEGENRVRLSGAKHLVVRSFYGEMLRFAQPDKKDDAPLWLLCP